MKFTDFNDLVRLAKEKGFTVTSTTGGKHNSGSRHGRGLAIDVRTKDKTDAECVAFLQYCRSLGLVALDERKRPPGQRVWGGAHIHVHIPDNLISKSTVIKLGDKGDAVRGLQRKLVNHGLLAMSDIDGHFGNKTLQAVKAFQYSKKMRTDGIAGENTLRELGN